MGTSVSTLVEINNGKEWVRLDKPIFPVHASYQDMYGEYTDSPFQVQHYGLFAFLADVCNYYAVPSIAGHRGLPEDHKSITEIVGYGGYEEQVSRYPYEITEGHSKTWITADELLNFNYDEKFEDRRDHCGFSSRDTLPEGKGSMITFRELLGEHYFKELEALKSFSNPNNVRIIFAFES